MRKGLIVGVVLLLGRFTGFGQTEAEYFKSATDKFQGQDLAGALTDFSKVIELNDKNTEAYFNRSVVKMNLKDSKGSIADLDTVVKRDPKREKAWANRASMKLETKDLAGALADYDKLIELNSKNTDVFFNRAILKKAMKDVKGAVQDLDTVIKRDPKNDGALKKRAEYKYELKDFAGAVNDYTEVLKLKEDVKIYINRIAANSQLKNTKAALEDYNKICQLDSTNADYFYAKATLERQGKDFKNATVSYSKVITLLGDKKENTKYSKSLLYRGMGKAEQFKYKDAIDDFSKIIEFNPKDKDALNQRVAAYQKLNMKNEACKDLDALISLGDKNAAAFKAQYCK